MPRLATLPRSAILYVTCVIVLGGVAIAVSAYNLITAPIAYGQWLILAGLTLLSGSVTVKVPSVPATISVSETFVFTAVLLFGPSAGTITVALDGLIISLWLRRKHVEAYRLLFNVAAPSVAIWLSAHLYFILAGTQPLSQPHTPPIHQLLLPLAAFTLSYFLLNSWLIAFAIAWEKQLSARRIWRENFFWLSLNFFGGASVAALLVAYTRQLSASAVGVIVPLVIISYLTYKTSMGRLEDATKHLSELNQLYVSTIETLAMAIDAKDQITHGHIRRVQTYAVGLARQLGVEDESLIKAVEAAALLHDIGKIGVPEHILNKPGKLTPAEFDRMKMHASIGGDLVSSIHFRDLVAPIVRHHHESWDGSGYPDGLAGTQIPVGARILAVVDCFDALTSDRPYRGRLADDEALAILIERRGTMYDPLVIDTFLRVFPDLSRQCVDVPPERPALTRIKNLAKPTIALPSASTPASTHLRVGASDVLRLFEISRVPSAGIGFADFTGILSDHLRRITPADTCAFYLTDAAADQLVAVHVHGPGQEGLLGHRIPLGRNVSGWVAVNREMAVNADARLDLGDVATTTNPPLRSCLGTPLMVEENVIGVLTLYSSAPFAFSDDDRRVLDLLRCQVSLRVRDALDFDATIRSSLCDRVTGLPNLIWLTQVLDPPSAICGAATRPAALIALNVDSLHSVNGRFGPAVGDSLVSHVAVVLRGALRAGDILFRTGEAEFVVLLVRTDAPTAEAIAERIIAKAGDQPLVLPDGEQLEVSVTAAVAMQPNDRVRVEDTLAAARSRLSGQRPLSRNMHTTVH